MITYAKKGSLHHKRLAFKFLQNKEAVKVLFDEIAREYVLGWEIIGEVIIVQILIFCNMIFCFLTFILIYKTRTDPTINLEDVWIQI